MKALPLAMLLIAAMSSTAIAEDDTYVKIQEMVNDLGGPAKQKKNNGKVLKCATRGTKKITITSSGGGTTYSGVYNNCTEYGRVRGGNVSITIGGYGGGDSADEFEARGGEPEDYSYEQGWDVTCKKNKSKCLATSGNIDFSYDGRSGKILGTYGIPKVKEILPYSYTALNKLFDKKLSATAGDSTAFFNWLSEKYVSGKGSWSACERGEKVLCDLSPSFNAAETMVDYYNMKRLGELTTKFLLETKYYKEDGNGPAISGEKDSLLNLGLWCSYGPCAEYTAVTSSKTGKPLMSNLSKSLDLLWDLKHQSSAPKKDRGIVTRFGSDEVEDADEPVMYQKAFESFVERYFEAFSDIEAAKSLPVDLAGAYIINPYSVSIRVVAEKLSKKHNLPLENSYYIASLALAGIYRDTISTGKTLRHIEVSDRWHIGLTNRAASYWPIKVNGKLVPTEEIEGWIVELEDVVEARIRAGMDAAPDAGEPWAQLGSLYHTKGLKEKAAEFYGKGVQKNPQDAKIWLDYGLLTKAMGSYEEALVKLETSIKLAPEAPNAYYEAGLICSEHLEDAGRAQRYWEKYLELAPSGERSTYVKELLAGA